MRTEPLLAVVACALFALFVRAQSESAAPLVRLQHSLDDGTSWRTLWSGQNAAAELRVMLKPDDVGALQQQQWYLLRLSTSVQGDSNQQIPAFKSVPACWVLAPAFEQNVSIVRTARSKEPFAMRVDTNAQRSVVDQCRDVAESKVTFVTRVAFVDQAIAENPVVVARQMGYEDDGSQGREGRRSSKPKDGAVPEAWGDKAKRFLKYMAIALTLQFIIKAIAGGGGGSNGNPRGGQPQPLRGGVNLAGPR